MDKNGKPIKESTTKSVNGALDLVTENTTSKIIIIVAVVVFLIVLACVGLRMMMNKSKMDMINEAMQRHDDIKNAESELSDVDTKKKKNLDDKQSYAEVNRESTVNMTTQNASGAKLNQYGEQYDPNQDFAIFATKNQAVGGHIGLKEKMNLADNKSERSDQSSIDIEEREKALKFKMSQRKVQRQAKEVITVPSEQTGSPNGGSQSPLASQSPVELPEINGRREALAEDKEIHELEEVE